MDTKEMCECDERGVWPYGKHKAVDCPFRPAPQGTPEKCQCVCHRDKFVCPYNCCPQKEPIIAGWFGSPEKVSEVCEICGCGQPYDNHSAGGSGYCTVRPQKENSLDNIGSFGHRKSANPQKEVKDPEPISAQIEPLGDGIGLNEISAIKVLAEKVNEIIYYLNGK